jgi:hypothetical protein
MSEKNVEEKISVAVLKTNDENSSIRSRSHRYGSADLDPDPYQNVMDPIRNTALLCVK